MAFPTTGVLDNFNTGASQNLTSRAGWNVAVLVSGSTYLTDGTPTAATITVPGGNWWGTTWVDSEVFVTLTTFTPATDRFDLCARITNGGANPTMYALRLANSGTNDFQIGKFSASASFTALGTLQSQVITNGDSIGLSVIGSQVTSYYKSGAGAWTQMDTLSDSSITGAGGIGFKHGLTVTNTVDNFGGGGAVTGEVSGPRQQTVPFTRGAGGGGKI